VRCRCAPWQIVDHRHLEDGKPLLPKIRRYGLQPARGAELDIVGRTRSVAPVIDRDVPAPRLQPSKQRLAPAAPRDAGGERIAVDRALLEQPHEARVLRPVGAISAPVDAGRHDPMVRSIFRGWGVAASGDGGRCERSLRRRFAHDRLHLASRRRGRDRGSQAQNLTQVFFGAAELKGIRPQRSAEPKMIPLPRYAHPQDTAIDAALARSDGAGGAPASSCCCATLPKLPTAFEALQPRRLIICQTVDFAGAGEGT
jgi:hypothetical protein